MIAFSGMFLLSRACLAGRRRACLLVYGPLHVNASGPEYAYTFGSAMEATSAVNASGEALR